LKPACAAALGVPFVLIAAVAWAQNTVRMVANPASRTNAVQSTALAAGSPANDTGQVIDCAVDLAHAMVFENDPFPSAKKCAKCHPQHFREWSVSPHAYAQLSPVFNAMSNKLIKLTSGTTGDFCIRCHTPVGMALDEPINMSNVDRHPTSREGVTCVVCHRINQAWGKGAGRQALVAGNINQAVFGPIGSEILEQVLANPDKYGVLSTGNYPGNHPEIRARDVHARSFRFFQLTTSGFCGTCHDVFAPNGFRLEDAFSEAKNAPAAEQCQSCQDCHMGASPGRAQGYSVAPAAVVGNATTPLRKHTNHMMAGPDHSIIHRGIFPHHLTAIREECAGATDDGLATMREWLYFDDAAGWGMVEFEEHVTDDMVFPSPWDDVVMRKKARKILDEQYQLLAESNYQRLQVLRAGYFLGEIRIERADCRELRFRVPVSNITPGHGVPTGFDAERVVFLRTMVWDGSGRLVYQSGDLDPNGDLRDNHSLYVHNGELPRDRQLLSLQSRFVTRNVRGGEREQILNVPYSLDPLPYIRPETRPFTVLGRPVAARKQKQNIEPEGCRSATYRLRGKQLAGGGPYAIRVQLIAGMVPVNLVHEISSVGFDYGMSARNVADAVVEGHLVLYERAKGVQLGGR
jgi:hypothetical protein